MENVLGLSVFKNHSTKVNWSFKINLKTDKLLSNKRFLKTFVNQQWGLLDFESQIIALGRGSHA